MSEQSWAPRRFWKEAGVAPREGGHAVLLDGRPVRTPAKAPLVLPTGALAEAIAAEWDAQGERVDPGTMPMTRTANSAIDTVAANRDAVIDLLAEYGATDLLCYRADAPEELAARQAADWDRWLDWADRTHGARLKVATGVLPVAQDARALAALRAPLEGMDAFALAGTHDLVALPGSLVLGLAVAGGALAADEAWRISRIDEDWQAELWGADDEAEAQASARKAALEQAARFHTLSRA
ncbi:ATP12 family chaperone protein [Wenxinia saemankumensis]|uniref:Chaperone required for the assembly of the F1-ATPase n=1 Tax=Wenxinia saemankumensis TaxID=1447782 RepID=A0A1M6CA30_9RHOB|nr:ATP12 family protein [Wenxinia saemankumensis]SHI57644.1 Chaperone required for the assembly of the F1-ATPase [Wenxinia saemankumensis]